jgi:hypothetical protein
MKIYLNGHELARTADDDRAVDQVLTELREEIRANGQVITQVALDGRSLANGWQRRRQLANPVSSVDRLELTIEEPASLRRQTLTDAASLVDRLVKQTKPLGRKFRVGDEVSANNELASFLEDLKLVLSGLDLSTRPLGSPLPSSATRQWVVDSASRLLPTLDRIYKAQARGDYIAIADEVEYDLKDQITGWKDRLSEVQQSLKPLPQA